MKTLKNFAAAVVAGAGLLAATSASAGTVTFDNVGDVRSQTFACPTSVCMAGEVSATITLTLEKIVDNVATFSVTVRNDSTNGTGDELSLVSFAFTAIAPKLVDASADGGWDATEFTKLTGTDVDLCVWDGENCNGGSNEGVAAGFSSTFKLAMTFDSTVSIPPIYLTDWLARFQGGSEEGPNWSGSFTLPGGDGGDGGEVPEPGILALLGLGLLGLGLRRRKVA